MTAFIWRFPLFFLGLLLAIRAFTAFSLDSVPAAAWIHVWINGVLADAVALLMVSCLLALGCLSSRPWFRWVVSGVVIAVVLIVAIAEVFFWFEFQARLDRLVFHYLAYPVEVLVFLEEQFYLKWILIPFALIVVLLARLLAEPPELSLRSVAVVWLGAGIAAWLSGQPVIEQSRLLTQLASNGYVGILTAARVNETRWNGLFPGVTPAREAFKAEPSLPPMVSVDAKHVVLIIEESFAGKTWEDPKERALHLPAFSALAGEGLRFDNVYAAGTRTTRGMESILNGFVPLPGISATERKGFERLPSLPRAFRDHGFKTVFAYGGWPGFSNFTPYWQGIGFEKTTSRYDFPEGTFETSWGVSDRDLFAHVLGLMDELTLAAQPIFLSTLTVSNHRPFVVPSGEANAEQRSLQAAMRYADSALGWFFAEARKRNWFDDTVFVVIADHAPRIYGDSLIPVESYRIPMLLISSPEVQPAVITERGSSTGIATTLLSLFHLPTKEQFWAPSLLDGQDGPVWIEHDYHVGELLNDRLTILARGGRFYQWTVAGHQFTPAGEIAADTLESRRIVERFSQAHEVLYPR